MKTLVVYFSRKGYVRRIAEETAQALCADIAELKTGERTAGIPGFWWCGRFAMHRWGMRLENPDIDTGAYDKVVICSPIWAFSVCAPVREFITRQAGKLKAADYVLVHYSFPMRYERTVARMDEILRLTHGSYSSICCMFGRILCKRVY